MLAYDAYGKPKNPVVLLLHGPGQDRATWKGVAEALADDHRVYCVDLPDHGDGGRAAVLDFAAALSLRRVCVIAHSPMAWSMAQDDVVDRLVVEDSAPADLDLVPGITAPTLVLSGGPKSGPPLREAAGLLAASEMVTIPVGHHIHRDAESTFVKVVSAFLEATGESAAAARESSVATQASAAATDHRARPAGSADRTPGVARKRSTAAGPLGPAQESS